MTKRTTIEIDEKLLARAKSALGVSTTRSVVEESLRLGADAIEGERGERATRQNAYLERFHEYVDLDVLASFHSEEMWR